MKTRIILLSIAVLFVTATANAQSGGQYEITWSTIDAGCSTSTGGPYELTGTIGQHDTGISSAEQYVLSAGFWPGTFGCIVNLTDLRIVAEQWLQSGALSADFDGNNTVDIADFAAMAQWWYDQCPADWPLK